MSLLEDTAPLIGDDFSRSCAWIDGVYAVVLCEETIDDGEAWFEETNGSEAIVENSPEDLMCLFTH